MSGAPQGAILEVFLESLSQVCNSSIPLWDPVCHHVLHKADSKPAPFRNQARTVRTRSRRKCIQVSPRRRAMGMSRVRLDKPTKCQEFDTARPRRTGVFCAATGVAGKSNVSSPGFITFAVPSFAGSTTQKISSGWFNSLAPSSS